MTLTQIVLLAFGVVVSIVLYRAFLRRGTNLLEAIPPLDGEQVRADLDVELSSMPRRRALVTTLAFVSARARLTSERLLVAQPALFAKDKRVVRYVIHLRPDHAREPSAWTDGYATFVLDREKSGLRGERKAELHLVPTDDAPFLPSYVVLRGVAAAELASLILA